MTYSKSEANKVNQREKQIHEMKKTYFFSVKGSALMEALGEESPQELQNFTETLLDSCDSLYTDYISEHISLTELKRAVGDVLKNENVRSPYVMINVAFVELRDCVFKLEEISPQSTNRNNFFGIQSKTDDDSDKAFKDTIMSP